MNGINKGGEITKVSERRVKAVAVFNFMSLSEMKNPSHLTSTDLNFHYKQKSFNQNLLDNPEGITLRKKDLSDRKNFESLLVEKAENVIGESLFEMIKIGVGFK